jgi:hypothetical protein
MNPRGEPIEPENFYDLFRDAQRTLGLRLRDLYATKDTYVSLARSGGVNLTWLPAAEAFRADFPLASQAAPTGFSPYYSCLFAWLRS